MYSGRSSDDRGGAGGAHAPQCLVSVGLPSRLEAVLGSHLAEHGIEVIAERRSAERRCGAERRVTQIEVSVERRRINNAGGRRVGERRARLVPLAPERIPELPRRARRRADQLRFVERIEAPAEELEDLDTARLVTRFQAGETEAGFAAIYSRYFDRVYGYLRVALKDEHEAEDGAQQVFTKVFENLGRYELRAQPFRAWLFTVTRNAALMQVRRDARLEVTAPGDLEQTRERLGLGPVTPVSGTSALEWISDGDLTLFIERLPDAQRQVLAMRYLLGMGTAEIAEVLGRTPNDISQLHSRAIGFLRDRLAAIGRSGRTHRPIRSRGRVVQAWVLRARRFALTR